VPDILVLGKGLSGGLYPMSATCYRPFLQAFFDRDPFAHVSSFGGSELGCTVALALLEEVAKPELLTHVNEMGARFAAGFERLRQVHPEVVVGYRQKGLMMALVMVNRRCGPAMTQALAERGVLALFANYDPAVLQVMPPLTITPEEVDEALAAMDGALTAVADTLGLTSGTAKAPTSRA
jgi:acetylornithine/succinyldiaminopimelate/putrescine aminotransferase